MPTFVKPSLGKIDVALSNYAQKLRNVEFVAESVAPRVPVGNQTDKYRIFGAESLKDPGDEVRAPTAAAIELVQTTSDDTYACVDHALSEYYPFENIGIPGMPDPQQSAVEHLTDRLMLKREIRMKDIVTNAANYAAANKTTLAGANQWSDPTSDPIGDVLTARKQVGLIGKRANLMIIGPDSFESLKLNTKIKERFTSVKVTSITKQDLEAIFEVPVVVAEGVIADAAGVKTYLWPDSAFIGHVQSGPSMDDVSFMKTFVWIAAEGATQGFKVVTSDATPASRNSGAVDVHFWYDHKITSAESGYLIIDTDA